MERCGWCGKDIVGEAVLPYEQSPLTWSNGDVEIEETPGFKVGFCCEGCAWAFGIEEHHLWGMHGKEVRRHLIDEHGLTPGKPAGKQSKECWDRFAEIAVTLMQGMLKEKFYPRPFRSG